MTRTFLLSRALTLLVAGLAGWTATEMGAAESSPAQEPAQGKFVWPDLVTTGPEVAVGFYTKLFGWTSETVSRGRESYIILSHAGHPVAGVAHRPAEPGSKAAQGARWVGSISVTDINQAVSAVTAAGGHLLFAPKNLAGRGWQAVVADPEGSIFGLIVPPAGHEKNSESRRQENSWAWVQLLSADPSKAIAFYKSAIGYEVAEDTRTPRPDDYLLSREGFVCAGLTPLPEKAGGRPGWLGYIRVADIAATLVAAEKLGGHVLLPAQNVPGALQVAIITDPLGGAVGLVCRRAGPVGEGAP
jgi:predicted enzyme related to lactoylglutathione lyase